MKRCVPTDSREAARLLDAFNREFGDPSPGVEFLERRIAEMISVGELTAFLIGEPPAGIAVLRFRRSIWHDGSEAYLAELYVEPNARGSGMGRALLEAAIDEARSAGAVTIDLNTSVDDLAARALYEKLGFTNSEGGPGGPSMLYYERDL